MTPMARRANYSAKFFGVIADTLREILGSDWSPDIEEAWRKLLVEIDRVVTQGAA